MKNATKHVDTLKALIKSLVKEHKPSPKVALDPLPALVRGAMSYDVADSRADEAMKAINKEFVDLNELRVATDLEIQELLGQKYPDIERRVGMITQSLNAIFEKEHTLSLDRLKTLGKRDARQFLRELPDVTPFVEAFVMLYAFDANAMPVDDTVVRYLVTEEIVEEGTTVEDAQKFIEHHVKEQELYDCYCSIRRAVNEEKKKKK